MLSPIEFLSTSLDIPYCHHERYDGSGYPRGLKGEDIPLTARIFTIIDVWDALLSDRPYRKAWELEQVLAYMKENSGIIFDPVLLNIFFTQVIDICAVSDED
jgi:HD-GYP domain-containing protein (c-di-GMP phosphodiesterase class II)